MAGNIFSNFISDIGHAVNAPVLFNWDTNAARRDAQNGTLASTGQQKRSLSSVAAQNDPMLKNQMVQDQLWTANPVNGTPVTGNGQQNIANWNGTGNGAGGNGAAVAPVGPSQAQLNPLFASLDSLDTVLGNKNSQSQAEYNRALQGYDAGDATDQEAYNKNVQQNEGGYTANNHAALLNAANGAKGLRGVLASLGALSGSGMDVINRLVGLAANQDAGASLKNFEANAGNLNQAWQATDQQHKQRRADASATLDNNMQNNKASVLNSRKTIYEQLANLYGDGAPQGNEYASKSAALAPEIAATTRASVAPYAAASSQYTPQALQQYLAGTQNLNVDTKGASEAPINSPLAAANTKKKDQLVGVA